MNQGLRQTITDKAMSSPYVALGVSPSSTDSAIIFAYERQISTDPDNEPFYMTYLKQIKELRSSEVLDTKLATEYSIGKYSSEGLAESYKYFGLSQTITYEDDFIIGAFKSRLQDAPKQESEMRQALRIIGDHRKSKRIAAVAGDILDTYDEALVFLGAVNTTTDEFIESLYTTKIAEDVTQSDRARQAVDIIATHRKSTALRTWLETGQMGESAMDIGEAYRAFQIEDRTVSDDMILSAYQVAIADSTVNVEWFNRALMTIADDRNSESLLSAMSGKAGTYTGKGSEDMPVGLENIGNTCYLNSLLQFLFTLTELRNIILNFDQYRMDLASAGMTKKQVGRRHVTAREVESSQKCKSNFVARDQCS